MMMSKAARFSAALLSLIAVEGVHVAAASAQTTNECTTYSIRVCATEDLGYSSLKECRLTEYANCMAGAPPIVVTAYQPSATNNVAPKSATGKHKPLNTTI